MRPKGPAVRSPGRKAGVQRSLAPSAEGAALSYNQIELVSHLRRSSSSSNLDPGLTAGPIHWRPFGPQNDPVPDFHILFILGPW
jgi:hypothetical protein